MDFLARLVFDVVAAFDDDLHLVVGVRVDEGVAFFEAVEAAADGGGGVEVLAVVAGVSWGEWGGRGLRRGESVPGEYITEEGVVAGDAGGFEGRLRFGVVLESRGGGDLRGVGHVGRPLLQNDNGVKNEDIELCTNTRETQRRTERQKTAESSHHEKSPTPI